MQEPFPALAARAVETVLAAHPELATGLGDHRYDDRLDDLSPAALEQEARSLAALLQQLDAVDPAALPVEEAVDARTLRTALRARRFALEELREHEWNPLLANPGGAVYGLLARDFAPLPERLRALAGRLAGVPERLDLARRTLRAMPRVHVETALVQFAGTRTLLTEEVERALDAEPALRAEVDPPRGAALAALDEHLRWLRAQLPGAGADPRLGPERFARKLELTLDTAGDAAAVLARAEQDLERVEEEIAETAAGLAGRAAAAGAGRDPRELVRAVLDGLADEGPVDDATVLPRCLAALEETTAFVREHDLVSVPEDPVEVIVMPEIHRGVAVAYCDPPGPLERRALPTYFAVSPTPGDWPPERVRSFYREYNAHLLKDLTVHEAMPGHVLQLAASRRAQLPTPVRSAFWSGSFVEGWAVYAEALMAERGYGGPAVRMQQLKMQLRMTINAILDARVHAHGMTEDEARRLMVRRGHQEEGEAVGKWRRALLTSAQLSTYFVGSAEVSDLVGELRRARPGTADRQVHDAVLAHGSPAPRHLRTLLGL